jgi:hypothetical protein
MYVCCVSLVNFDGIFGGFVPSFMKFPNSSVDPETIVSTK